MVGFGNPQGAARAALYTFAAGQAVTFLDDLTLPGKTADIDAYRAVE